MRRALACLALGASLTLAGPLYAAPLDDWLGAVTADHQQIVIAPRLGAVVEPAARLWARGLAQPAVASASADLRGELEASLGFDPLDIKVLKARGVALDGPLIVATGPDRGWAALPITRPAAAGDVLAAATGEAPAPLKIDGAAGWQWTTGVGVWRGGMLFVARSVAELQRVLAARAGPDLLGDCGRAKGQADLFVLRRDDRGAGCLTARMDPDRLRVEARLRVAGVSASDWLAPDGGLPALGAEVDLAGAFRPGPLAAAAFAQRLAAAHPALAGLNGRLAFALGPGLTDVVVRLGRRATAAADRALTAAAKQGRPGLRISAEAQGRWLVELAEVAAEGPAPSRAPQLNRAWLLADAGRLLLTTRASDAGGAPLAGAPRAAVSRGLFDGAALAFWLRASGAPHDGGAYADAIAPVIDALGLEVKSFRALAGAAAYIWAHIGEVGLAVRPVGPAFQIAVEVVLL